MQLLKSSLKSNRIATLAVILLAMAYVVPELIGGKLSVQTASDMSSGNTATKTKARQGQFDIASFDAALSEVSFQLDDIRDGGPVPRFYVDQIPADILDLSDVEKRKKTFIKLVLPQVLSVNEGIEVQRERLTGLLEKKAIGASLKENDRKWLQQLALRYREETIDPEALMEKVDKIPVSIALAQAVEESGWGTSRFAREGNALFGQRVWSTGGGIVPEDRSEDETHEVRAFKSIAESIRSYAHNLNVHPAYEDFREARAWSRTESNTETSGLQLIDTLHGYSEKGQEYVDNLRTLIQTNNFQDFEDAILMPEQLADNRP
ncbi:MAG: hypothetical protein CMN56_12975 [Sneathiella sp.]|jgi:Bax protein|uniref:glucosaminidase domain-containing protein n=1 Tax=Sneathiella sp. TaxID=1964365 RepID=UPI000C58F437|nr:glucosaminidase domain-containing protein [Sneathiella sp.]MAZ04037.1 hypothetical protein [Sneathiella sp.]